ncbi:hypothetical protein OG194_43255 [Streptomyces sp. NBC_01288]|nr:hypothetical protein OG194_43255 [Streptomyces sp. NBC_01288]
MKERGGRGDAQGVRPEQGEDAADRPVDEGAGDGSRVEVCRHAEFVHDREADAVGDQAVQGQLVVGGGGDPGREPGVAARGQETGTAGLQHPAKCSASGAQGEAHRDAVFTSSASNTSPG